VRRVSVVGNSGAGKSTLARTLAGALDAEFRELDSVFHQAGWVPLPGRSSGGASRPWWRASAG
jgi:ABC-type glutathione transport system ATPase component